MTQISLRHFSDAAIICLATLDPHIYDQTPNTTPNNFADVIHLMKWGSVTITQSIFGERGACSRSYEICIYSLVAIYPFTMNAFTIHDLVQYIWYSSIIFLPKEKAQTTTLHKHYTKKNTSGSTRSLRLSALGDIIYKTDDWDLTSYKSCSSTHWHHKFLRSQCM